MTPATDIHETEGLYSKANAVRRMNELGALEKPFLFIIDFEMLRPIIKALPLIEKNILFDINGFTNADSKAHNEHHKEIIFSKTPVSFELYKKAFDEVMENLHEGYSYLVNLTQPSEIKINLTGHEIFMACEAKYSH